MHIMKFTKILCCALLLTSVSFVCSCIPTRFIESKNEEEIYEETINSLFTALDTKDKDAVIELFSPFVRNQHTGLDAQVEKLFAAYEGPVSEIGWVGLLQASESMSDGDHSQIVESHFPVLCDDTYYWIYMRLVLENDGNEDEIGVAELCFYTADEYYEPETDDSFDENIKNELPEEQPETCGLFVYAEKNLVQEIRCINGQAVMYTKPDKVLNISEVEQFFEESDDYSEFKAKFGEPVGECIYTYYELPEKNGKVQYLQVSVTQDEKYIDKISIVDDFEWLENIGEE